MRDKRPVDELTIEELEQILLIRKREARLQRFRGGDRRRVETPVPPPLDLQLPIVSSAASPVLAQPEPVEPALYQPPILDDGGVPQFEDELMPPLIEGRRRGYAVYDRAEEVRWRLWRRLTNGALLVIEVGAIAGLLLLLFFAYRGLTTVNRNIEKTDRLSATSEALLAAQQIQPTATPLISVSQVVLPGGHVWDASGRHRFNLNEVPAPYRSAFEAQLNAPAAEIAPVPEGGPIRVQISAIGVDASIRSGDDWITLQAGVGHQPNSGNPGVAGNMVLTGHNDIFGEVFRRLEELQPGNEVRVQSTTGQWYTYVVRDKQIVDPSEVWVLDQNLGQQKPIVTLITCYPYRVNTHRIVVFAELVSS